MVNRRIARIVVLLSVCLLVAMPVLGQEDGLTISVSKQFGYNMGSQIQGTFKVGRAGRRIWFRWCFRSMVSRWTK